MNKEQILAMEPGRESNWLIHMVVMGNKAWKYLRYGCGIYREEIEFSPEPSSEKHEEISLEEVIQEVLKNWTRVCEIPDYFGDISAAWEVVEKLRNNSLFLNIYMYTFGCITYISTSKGLALQEVKCDTAPETICKAALLALGEVKEREG